MPVIIPNTGGVVAAYEARRKRELNDKRREESHSVYSSQHKAPWWTQHRSSCEDEYEDDWA